MFAENEKNNSDDRPTGAHFIKGAADELRQASQSFKKMIKGLRFRHNVLMVRINDECLKKIDALVDAGIFQSRSECGAFLLSEGIKSQSKLFDKIEEKISQIDKLKQELKNIVAKEMAE